MRGTFDMGIGMVLVISPVAANKILENRSDAQKVYHIGEVISGKGMTYA
jgi:phosphoribosylformylglycinamidine cyclo-ligase